jgi:hypothetical protein
VAEIQGNGSPMQVISVKRSRFLSEMDKIKGLKILSNPSLDFDTGFLVCSLSDFMPSKKSYKDVYLSPNPMPPVGILIESLAPVKKSLQ